MELYIEQLLPPIISCLVNPVQYKPSDNHWAMRDYCAKLLSTIVDMYRVKYETLLPRIVKTMNRNFNSNNLVPFSRSYGKRLISTRLHRTSTNISNVNSINYGEE